MSYVINRFSGQQLVVLEDGTLDTSTSIGLLGRNYVGYGEVQNENFLFLLENFANASPPARSPNSTRGQNRSRGRKHSKRGQRSFNPHAE